MRFRYLRSNALKIKHIYLYDLYDVFCFAACPEVLVKADYAIRVPVWYFCMLSAIFIYCAAVVHPPPPFSQVSSFVCHALVDGGLLFVGGRLSAQDPAGIFVPTEYNNSSRTRHEKVTTEFGDGQKPFF